MNKLLELVKGLHLFKRAYDATKHQIWISVFLLLIVTVVFALLMWIAEGNSNPNFNFWDALVWTFVKNVDDPAGITSSPITVFGQIVGTMVGVLGIAIFAVPAGLIGSGLMEAMDEKKHEEEIESYHQRIIKAFRRGANKSLRTYLNSLPDGGGENFARMNFVPQSIPVAKLQVRQGMELKDVFEVCQKYPELRMKNQADARSDEENPEDRFIVECFPVNRAYGCCIDRDSNVTIVSPTGFSEVGISWFTYYVAKLGGFNYICKDIEVDQDELDSYYNLSDEPLYNKKKKSDYTAKDVTALKILEQKARSRQQFIDDIKRLNKGKDSWVIIMTDHQKNTENTVDFHFSDNRKDGSTPTALDRDKYEAFINAFSTVMQSELDMISELDSKRYPLLKNNLAFRLQQMGITTNTFVLRASTWTVNFSSNKLVVAFRMAQVISEQLDHNRGILKEDVEDLATPAFGFAEIE